MLNKSSGETVQKTGEFIDRAGDLVDSTTQLVQNSMQQKEEIKSVDMSKTLESASNQLQQTGQSIGDLA